MSGRRRDLVAKDFNVSAPKVKNAIELLRTDPIAAAEVLSGKQKLSKALGGVKRAKQLALVDKTPPPTGKYSTIVVDPPWAYNNEGPRGGVGHHYPTMAIGEIAALPVADLAGGKSHLYLWTTPSHLESAFKLVRGWGFDFKTMLFWRKVGADGRPVPLGLGHYFRGEVEPILFATKGNLPLKANNLRNYFEAPRRKHSEKPDAFYSLVESASFEPRIDLFARKRRPGWSTWGAELPPEPAPDPAGGRASAIHQTGSVIKPPDDDATK